MDYTFVMYSPEKQSFSAVSSPDGLSKHKFGAIFHFLHKSTFFVLNDQKFSILIQVYSNHSGCFNLTKIPLHRELFLRVSWRRGGSGGKAGGN